MTGAAPVDLRLPLLAGCAWASAASTTVLPLGTVIATVAAGVVVLGAMLACRCPRRAIRTMAAGVLMWSAVAAGVLLRGAIVHESWVAVMARDKAIAHLTVEIRGDPKISPGQNDDRAIVGGEVRSIEARGKRSTAEVPVMLVLSSSQSSGLRFGGVYAMDVRLQTSLYPDTAALAVVRSTPRPIRAPALLDRVASRIRDSIQAASSGQTTAAGLVPALIDGDARTLPPGLSDDFQAAGLSHLLAVSGTTFALLGAAWLAMARRCGVRGRALVFVGLVGIVFLAVVARGQPSVIRASVMGAVALLGLGHGGRRQGLRALSACICVVMLFDPALAFAKGFVLSSIATAGIILFANRWRGALETWLPRFLAEPLALTLAAYVTCLPLIVAWWGRLSLIAIPVNLAADLAIAPATILGFVAGVVGLVTPGIGRFIAAPATWCASWIVGVAHAGARTPHADIGVASDGILLVVLTCGSLMLLLGLHRILERPRITIALIVGSVLASSISVPWGTWPPPGWVLVACDVGQGDGLAVSLGGRRAIIIDTGPDPRLMSRCVRDLHIQTVPLLVLTHFHSDHVNGLAGVLSSAKVSTIDVTDLAEPSGRATFVRRMAAAAHVPIRQPKPGEQGVDGQVRWQVLAPLAPPPPDSDSPPNDASIVLLVETRGIRLLLMGDEETGSQTLLNSTYPDLKVDVLKVAHHGSAKQDPSLIARLGAKDAIISAGRGNSYGLPKASTLDLLRRLGMRVHRTDIDGPIAVVSDGDGAFHVVAKG